MRQSGRQILCGRGERRVGEGAVEQTSHESLARASELTRWKWEEVNDLHPVSQRFGYLWQGQHVG